MILLKSNVVIDFFFSASFYKFIYMKAHIKNLKSSIGVIHESVPSTREKDKRKTCIGFKDKFQFVKCLFATLKREYV